jgi:hypothetical protein
MLLFGVLAMIILIAEVRYDNLLYGTNSKNELLHEMRIRV